MRELSTGGHKLRRPSFSNTLSELPEVEEPEYVGDTLSHMSNGTITSFNVLPPINYEDVKPSPRPRFNTIPEGVTERPKYLNKTTIMKIDMKLQPARDRLDQRNSPPNSLDKTLTGPHKTRMAKRKKSVDMAGRRPSLNSENPQNESSRRPSLTVPPLQRCDESSVSTSLDNKRTNGESNNNNMMSTSNLSTSMESVDKAESITGSVCDTETSDKTWDVIKWRKALDKAKINSPYGSFENLNQPFLNDGAFKSRRRYSMPVDPKWDRRWSSPVFADTSRRVDILLKYGKAMRNRYNNIPTKNKSPPLKTVRTLADFMVEMPKKPRFSSFMSPEAQYSLMKGYEDKLYRKLSSSLPDYNPLLKRNKTPKNTVIDIKSKNTLGFLNDSDDDDDDDNGDDNDNDNNENFNEPTENGIIKTNSSFLTQIEQESVCNNSEYAKSPAATKTYQESPSTVITDSVSMKSESQELEDTKNVLKNLRRLSISIEKGCRSINKPFHENYEEEEEDICSTFSSRQRSHSMPSVTSVPFQRRLMMSYRLQSAMDILDNIKSEGDTTLSPRLKVKRGANLSEYNTWVSEWNKEFCLRNCNE